MILKVDRNFPDTKAVDKAAKILKAGGLIIYPTDTAYGLGANALDPMAVFKVYQLKGRDFSKPTHVVVSGWRMIEKLTFTNYFARKLFDAFLPGPLTIILRKKPIVPDILTANLPTLGIRIPDSKFTYKLSNRVNFPYTATSANKSGGETPYSTFDVGKEIGLDNVDLAINAGLLPKVAPSTIIDTTDPVSPKILREGPITKEALEKVIGKVV